MMVVTNTTTTRKPAEEVKVGDVLDFLGGSHLITSIPPYTHPTLGATLGIATDAAGWGMVLYAGASIAVKG